MNLIRNRSYSNRAYVEKLKAEGKKQISFWIDEELNEGIIKILKSTDLYRSKTDFLINCIKSEIRKFARRSNARESDNFHEKLRKQIRHISKSVAKIEGYLDEEED